MKKDSNLAIITGSSNTLLAEKIAKYLNIELSSMEISHFKDGEVYVRIEENVRGKDVFIIQPTSKDVNYNLMELAIIIDAVKRSSAKRITAVIPYYGYARQDRQAKPQEPITAKLVANLIATSGAGRVLTLDLHSDQIEGFFDIPVDHLHASELLVEYFVSKKLKNLCIIAPDTGAAKKTRRVGKMLNAPIAIIDKRRVKHNEVEEMTVVGEVKGKNCIILDDMIDTAGTVSEAAKALKKQGALDIYVAATHGIFSEPAIERLSDKSIKEIIVTDSINQIEKKLSEKFKVLSVANLFAEAINTIHADESNFKTDSAKTKKLTEF